MAMAICTPDGTLQETLGEDGEEEHIPPGTPESKDGDDCGMSPPPRGSHGGRGASVSGCRCSSIGGYAPDPPGPYHIIEQLVVALHDAGLSTNPKH